MKRKLKLAILALAVILLIAQAFPVDKNNPPVIGDVQAPPEVKLILVKSCYGCHSNETTWPWYSNIFPVSWLVANDVHEGRRELNFSVWDEYSHAKRQKKLHEIQEEVASGAMPPWYYIYPMHMDARLSPAEHRMINDWIASESARLNSEASQP